MKMIFHVEAESTSRESCNAYEMLPAAWKHITEPRGILSTGAGEKLCFWRLLIKGKSLNYLRCSNVRCVSRRGRKRCSCKASFQDTQKEGGVCYFELGIICYGYTQYRKLQSN